jgi:hypothetical protein
MTLRELLRKEQRFSSNLPDLLHSSPPFCEERAKGALRLVFSLCLLRSLRVKQILAKIQRETFQNTKTYSCAPRKIFWFERTKIFSEGGFL